MTLSFQLSAAWRCGRVGFLRSLRHQSYLRKGSLPSFAPLLEGNHSPGMSGEKPLHRPVSQALERNHRHPSAGLEQAKPALERPFQLAQLVIDRHAECLKRPRGGMMRPASSHGLLDQRRQLRRRLDPCDGARLHDRPRDPPGVRFLSERAEQAGQFVFAPRRHDVGRRFAARPIHPHVQRAVRSKAEPAIRLVELRTRHAQIEKDAVHGADSFIPHDLRDVSMASMHQRQADARNSFQAFGAFGQCQRVAVDTHQSRARARACEDFARMAGPAQCPVNVHAARFHCQRINCLFQKNWLVHASFLRNGASSSQPAGSPPPPPNAGERSRVPRAWPSEPRPSSRRCPSGSRAPAADR